MAWDKNKPSRTTKMRHTPPILTANWGCIEDFSGVEHYGLTHALSGRHKPGAPLWAVNSTTNLNALTSCVACAAAFDTTLNSMKYNNGTIWVDLGGTVASGTKMLFYADTAPVGWSLRVQDDDGTAVDNTMAFITKGSGAGGQKGGDYHTTSTWTEPNHTHTSLGCTLTIAQIAAHGHELLRAAMYDGTDSNDRGGGVTPHGTATTSANVSIIVEGGGGAHTSTYIAGGTQATWRPAAYTCIICEKD